MILCFAIIQLGFNPCFSGTTTYTFHYILLIISYSSFNPCFSGTTTYTPLRSVYLWASRLVSILVFLEPPLILESWMIEAILERCFNPCFSGTTTYTNPYFFFHQFRTLFQSLFFWNHHLYGCRNFHGKHRWAVVSILVFLEPPLIPLTTSTIDTWAVSFNPCFSGTTTYTPSFTDLSSKASSFNPCFSGTTTYTTNSSPSSRMAVSFNPCFSGTTTYTRLKFWDLIGLTEFQSLFFWNHHLYTPQSQTSL